MTQGYRPGRRTLTRAFMPGFTLIELLIVIVILGLLHHRLPIERKAEA